MYGFASRKKKRNKKDEKRRELIYVTSDSPFLIFLIQHSLVSPKHRRTNRYKKESLVISLMVFLPFLFCAFYGQRFHFSILRIGFI